MKFKKYLFLLVLVVLVPRLHGEINGYLSFDFVKGQTDSFASKGSFQNVLLGLILSGDMTPKVDYLAEARFKDETRLEMEQAYLRIRPSQTFSLKLGLYLVPFGRYNISNRPHQTVLVKAPLLVENLYPQSWRDIGLLIEGKWRGLSYSGYLGNGITEGPNLSAGQQFKDNNKDKGKGGRIGLSLSQGLEGGFSYYVGRYDENNERNLILKGGDLSWTAEGVYILAEYAQADINNPAGFSKGRVEGYFVQISFDMGPLRPVGSYQKLTYQDGFHGQEFRLDLGGEGIDEDKNRWTIGLVYFATADVIFKLEYEWNREKDKDIKNNLFLFQLALNF